MQFVLGVIGIILIYFLGNLLYPDSKQKEIIQEPRQLDFMRKDQIVEEISDEGKEKIVEDELEKVLSNAKTMSPNEFHTKMCYVLMAMAVIGGVFSFIGYILAPDSCGDENTVFEDLGFALFMMSMYAVPINIIIWIVSLFKSDVDSGQVFVLVCLHTLVAILSMFIFGDNYIAQDMFCDSEVFVGGVF
tara:strand:- start:185 stop:751 length:567 start_codon:yes stop_codon:yes gene_type:complete